MDTKFELMTDGIVAARIAVVMPLKNFRVSSVSPVLTDAIKKQLTRKQEFVFGGADVEDGDDWVTASPVDGVEFMQYALLGLPTALQSLYGHEVALDIDGDWDGLLKDPPVDDGGPTPKSQPTQAQAEAGNYKKKHVDWNGLDVSIENEAGSTRSGQNKSGKTWSTKMHYDYGYTKRTEGVDGDHVDVYLGPNKAAEVVYIVHQAKPATGEYDEDKCMLGFDSEDEAKAAYLKQYNSPKFLGAISAVPFALFKEKVLSDKGEPIVPDAKRLVAGERLKSLIAMHLPGKHVQKTHGHGSKIKMFNSETSDDADQRMVDARLAKTYLQDLVAKEQLTQTEKNTVSEYISDGYDKWNLALRQRGEDIVNYQLKIKAMDSAIKKSAGLSESIVVHRGILAEGAASFFNSLRVGDTIHDAGYMSTSLDFYDTGTFGQSQNQVWLEIRVPTGQKFVVGNIGEHELIFGRNTALIVIAVETIDYSKEIGENRTRLVLEMQQ